MIADGPTRGDRRLRGFQILDLTGPAEVFAGASRALAGRRAVPIEVVTSGGVRSGPRAASRSGPTVQWPACRGPIDTLVVVGGEGTRPVLGDRAGRMGPHGGRPQPTGDVGVHRCVRPGPCRPPRRAAGHHPLVAVRHAGRLFPAVTVEPDPIFVRDGNVWTSAGVTAGMDLALRLVEEDHGAELARTVARWLVLFVQRPGGQSQFSAQLAAQRPAADPIRALQDGSPTTWTSDLRVGVAGRAVRMSPRHFARVFRAETGVTPAAYVEASASKGRAGCSRPPPGHRPRSPRPADSGRSRPCTGRSSGTLGVTPGQYRAQFRARARTTPA